MPSYDASRFDPPAPVAQVALRDMQTGATVRDVPLLLDTGADITLLPQVAVERLGVAIQTERSYELRGFDGSISAAPVVVLDLIFLGRAFRGPYLVIAREDGIVGRDVLNHVSLLLDGPLLLWSEQTI